MKRSVINSVMQDAVAFFQEEKFALPPFALWTVKDWQTKGAEAGGIVRNGLGWDLTDYGLDDFYRYGLLLFTLRNGNFEDWQQRRGRPYCEKIMIAEVGQEHQMHHHRRKVEDIINRGGGRLAIRLFGADKAGELVETEVSVEMDGVWRCLPASSVVMLHPGESITLTPGIYHKFWAEGSRVMMGEVSTINDDREDNFFYQTIGAGRFSPVEEDAPPLYPLFSEYGKYWQPENN